MYRYTSLIVVLPLCFLLAMRTEGKPKSESGSGKKSGAMKITVTGLQLSDKSLNLRYEIRNDSEDDIWICEDITLFQHDFDFEVYLAEDNQTILIRRLLDVPAQGSSPTAPHGRYVRLRTGQTRTESLSLALPIQPRRVFFWATQRQGTVYAKRLSIEIGYYAEDVPGMIRGILEKAEKIGDKNADNNLRVIKQWFGSLWRFNELHEYVRDRNEDVVIPWTDQAFKGEQLSRVTVDGLRIPYEEKYDWPEVSPPDLTPCTRLEIQYQPSMLDYFFPYASQQNLLSPAEKQYLQSLKTIDVNNPKYLKAFANEISHGYPGGIVTERSTANVICYQDDKRLTSFTIYDDVSIVTAEKQRFRYKMGLPSLKPLTPQMRSFELRVRCAANLRDLWHRLHLYQKAKRNSLMDSSSKTEITYPTSSEWCESMVQAYRNTIGSDRDAYMMRPYMCPSAGDGKCHYAMNPNCKPDSPPDTVLLFETKAGWNQHGGPELFTFDNHDPKGGCVLLNDGTVKFIRTQEELHSLRWK